MCVSIAAVLFFTFIDLVNSDYCFYFHEDYLTVQQKYCKSGCCRDVGDDDEICCFEWTVGVILGICFAAITVIAIVVIVIICCYTINKKRNRTGTVIDAGGTNISNTIVYSASSAGYSYPHPPSAFYPGSQFPNAPPAYGPSPKYGMYPSSDISQSQTGSQNISQPQSSVQQNIQPPPSYTTAMKPVYPQQEQYGGYGTGLT